MQFPVAVARQPGRVALRVLDGDLQGKVLEVPSTGPYIVGRTDLADLRVSEPSVSSVHFEVRPLPTGGAVIRDLESKNGMWFHDRRIQEMELCSGDPFRAGSCRLVLASVGHVDVEVLKTSRFGRLCGSSVPMRELYRKITAIAPTPLDVLILGETGTGKELVARTIHEYSERRGAFVVLDCGALSPTLADGTIFGFRKGAFTGADQDQPGVFEAAEGGTLFIDEVGELPLEMQVKLLRALDTRTVTRLGEPGNPRRVDVRVVSATHRELRASVAAQTFREDLYYRLARSILHTPPLRERGDDIIEIADYVLENIRFKHQLRVWLGDAAKSVLLQHAWPGNVRELRNAVELAAHMTREGEISLADLHITRRAQSVGGKLEQLIADGANLASVHETVDKMFLSRLLDIHGHSISAVARAAGISRDRLRRRLKELGLYSKT